MAKDLVQIIKDNPGCIATIDNDSWWLHRAPPMLVEDMSETEYDDWRDFGVLACDSDVESIGMGYGAGCAHGGDILQALAIIVGIKIESV